MAEFRRFILSILLSSAFFDFSYSQGNSRNEFQSKMKLIERGMSKELVAEILGEPDQKLNRDDALKFAGEVTPGTIETWNFGKEFERDFPCLGQINFDTNEKVIAIIGKSPVSTELNDIEEQEIRALLRSINTMPDCYGSNWCVETVVDVANNFLTYEQSKGLALIEEYLRLTPKSTKVHQQVCLLLKLLHDVPENKQFPNEKFGGAIFGEPQDRKIFPRFPIHLIDGIPVILVRGYQYSGPVPNDTWDLVNWYRKNAKWRTSRFEVRTLSSDRILEMVSSTKNLMKEYLDDNEVELTSHMIELQLQKLKCPESEMNDDYGQE